MYIRGNLEGVSYNCRWYLWQFQGKIESGNFNDHFKICLPGIPNQENFNTFIFQNKGL